MFFGACFFVCRLFFCAIANTILINKKTEQEKKGIVFLELNDIIIILSSFKN